MFNYIASELKRLLKKRSSYFFYGIFLVLFTIILFVNQNQSSSSSMSMMGMVLVMMSSIIFGSKIFYSVFGDDLQHKTLSLVFSTGLSRFKYVLSKIIVFILAVLGVYLILTIYYWIIWILQVGSGPNFSHPEVMMLIESTKATLVSLIGFGSIAAMISYMFQNSNAGGILLPFMMMGLTNQILSLLTLAFDWLKEPFNALLSSQLNNANTLIQTGQKVPSELYLVAIVYVIIGIIVSTIVLTKKDIQIN